MSVLLKKVGNYKPPCPSEYVATTSTIVDSGRSITGKVIGAVVREDVGAVDVTFAYISVGVWAKILQQFDSKYGGSFYQWVTFFDQVSAKESTRKMYVGDRTTAGMHLLDKNGKPQAWLGAKLQLVEK